MTRLLACLCVTVIAAFAAAACGGSGTPYTNTGPPNTGTTTPTGTGTTGNPGDAMPVDLGVAIAKDATLAQIEAIGGRYREAAPWFWKATEGQMYFKSFNIADKSQGGNRMVYHDGELDSDLHAGGRPATTMGAGNPSTWNIRMGCIFVSHEFLHEFGHGIFGMLPREEYDCDPCLMSAGMNDLDKYCDKSNCTVNPADSCWENYMLRFYSDWKHPNDGFSPDAPEPQINITDN